MSINTDFTSNITLLDRKQFNRTIIDVKGDSTTGNLTKYRRNASWNFATIKKNRNATLVLRAQNGLFTTDGAEPLLIRPEDYDLYLIEVQMFQHTRVGDAGHPDPVGRVGELVRYEIADAVQDADEKGEIVTLTLIDIAQRTRESPDSMPHRLQTPKQSFINRYSRYNTAVGVAVNAPFFTLVDNNIDLPDDQYIKQDWTPGAPRFTQSLVEEIIKKVSKPIQIGGNFTDHYWYYVTHATITNQLEVFAEPVGTQSSGVVLDAARAASSQNTYEKKHTQITTNKNYKNVAIVRGANGAHDLPFAYTIFKSQWEHAKISAAWSASVAYVKGDFVKFANELYMALSDTLIGDSPVSAPAKWENLSTATRQTPLTTSTDLWKAFGGKDDPTGDGFYETVFVDMNISQPNYDRTDVENEFEAVSLKDVEDFIDIVSVPAAEIVHGKRWLVNGGTGAWAGQNNKVAQYDEFKDGGAGWQFSVAPVTDDTVTVRKLSRILRFDGAVWQTEWDLPVDYAKSSPFHPVKAIRLATGPDGVVNSAIEFEFDWNFVNKAENLASRWAGFSFRFPAPQRAKGALAVGDVFAAAYLDFANLEIDPVNGNDANWNDGINTMNLGELRGISTKIEFDARDVANNKIDGLVDLPFEWWFKDIQDRTVYKQAILRMSKGWGKMTVAAGPNEKMELHDNRADELIQILGYTIPWNGFLKEKEYTGINFDWNKVKEIGCFYKGSYDDNFFYKGAQNAFLDAFTALLTQMYEQLVSGGFAVGKHTVDRVHLRLSDFRFLKDAYVTTASGVVNDFRSLEVNANRHFDYLTMVAIGEGELARAKHYPLFTPIDAYTDVRIRVGQDFVAQGPRWNGSPRTMVCAEYTIHEGPDGNRMQVLGYEKFEGTF
jgi:hypothetical protein